MALTGSFYQDGILTIRGESNITLEDAQTIAADINARGVINGLPVVVLLDLSRISRVASAAHIVFADMARWDKVSALVFVTRHPNTIQSVRAIVALSERGRVHFFESMREAHLFARVWAHNAQATYAIA
jgi:hypothetical protein